MYELENTIIAAVGFAVMLFGLLVRSGRLGKEWTYRLIVPFYTILFAVGLPSIAVFLLKFLATPKTSYTSTGLWILGVVGALYGHKEGKRDAKKTWDTWDDPPFMK